MVNRTEYLEKLEVIKSVGKSNHEIVLEHEWLLCEYVKSLEEQLAKTIPHPIEMVNMIVGDLVLLRNGSATSIHYVTSYGKDEKLSEYWGYDGNITKLDGTYCYLKEDGTSLGDKDVFATKVFHSYDRRFKCASDR